MLQNSSDEISGGFEMSRFLIKLKALSEGVLSKCRCSLCSLASGQAWSGSHHPLVRFVDTCEHWARSIMPGVFMTLIDSSTTLTLGEKTWIENWFSSLLVPIPLLHPQSQTCRKVREITNTASLSEGFGCLCLYWFVNLMIFSIIQPVFSLSIWIFFSFSFFFGRRTHRGPICIPVWLGHPLCSWCFEHAPRCAYSSVVVHLRNLVN